MNKLYFSKWLSFSYSPSDVKVSITIFHIVNSSRFVHGTYCLLSFSLAELLYGFGFSFTFQLYNVNNK